MPTSATQIHAIQKALTDKGFDPGGLDGIRGRRTENAVRAFQQANGLQVDGIVGPQTRRALLGTETKLPALEETSVPWFQTAKSLMGTR